jgi:hypothetical protein
MSDVRSSPGNPPPPNLRRVVLTSARFQEELARLHASGDVERKLEEGAHPLSAKKPARDIERLLDATRHELAVDLAEVVRAALAGADAGDLGTLATMAIRCHEERAMRLCGWFRDLGLTAWFSDPGFLWEGAWSIAELANRHPSTIHSAAFSALTDGLWCLVHDWHSLGHLPAVPVEPADPVRTPGDVRRNLRRIFRYCGRQKARRSIVIYGPLTHRLIREELPQLIHSLDIAEGSAVRLPSPVVFVPAESSDEAALAGRRTNLSQAEEVAVPAEQPPLEAGSGVPATAATDDTAFRPASNFLDSRFPHYKSLWAVLAAHPWIRRQKPSPQRLRIHAGDWHQYLSILNSAGCDVHDLSAETVDNFVAEVQQRKEAVRQSNAGN